MTDKKLHGSGPVSPSFTQARDGEAQSDETRRGSQMVANDKPHPAPRPSPDWAHDADQEAFNAAWEREAREARREAFRVKRSFAQTQRRDRHATR